MADRRCTRSIACGIQAANAAQNGCVCSSAMADLFGWRRTPSRRSVPVGYRAGITPCARPPIQLGRESLPFRPVLRYWPSSADRAWMLICPGWRLAPGPPGVADRAGARLADVEPSGGVDPEDVEFEDRIVRHGLDHSAYAAAGDHRERRRPQARVVPGFSRAGPDGQLVILGAGKGVDRAPGLAPQVVALRRGAGDGRQEPAAGQNGAERVQPGGCRRPVPWPGT